MKKILIFLSLFLFCFKVSAEDITKYSKSAILYEANTNKVLYELNSEEKLKPASMTKIMSMILIMEAIDNGNITLNDKVLISKNASDMGGSQVYLNTGEEYKVSELLKSIAIASANDAVVAMSEKVAGTEEKFVELMNNKCSEIGCACTEFKNPHGLDTEGHYSCAKDMALMGSYLINHYPTILNYTSIYEDYLQRPDGSNTWLVNTNKLVRFYNDVDGLKTGYTEGAGYCITATASKNNMRLVSVVMGVDTIDNRTSDTVKLLNYGFNSYKMNTLFKKDYVIGIEEVNKGKKDSTEIVLMNDANILVSNNDKLGEYSIDYKVDKLIAPLKYGKKVGSANILDNEGNIVSTIDITVKENIKKASFWDYFKRNLKISMCGKNI